MELIRLGGIWQVHYEDLATGRRWASRRYKNTACESGKDYIAAWLNGENPTIAAGTIYGAVGTGSGTPNLNDTQLFAELARVSLAVSSRSFGQVTFDFYFGTSQAVGTWTEAGLFLGASASANSGSIMSHVLLSEAKTSTIAATLAYSIAIGP